MFYVYDKNDAGLGLLVTHHTAIFTPIVFVVFAIVMPTSFYGVAFVPKVAAFA